MRPLHIFLIVFGFLNLALQAQETDLRRSSKFFGGVHFAGNTGLVSFNVGKKFFKNHLSLGVGYGYLPENLNGAEVHTILLKTTYTFGKDHFYNKVKFYTGFSTIYGITSNTFIKLPNHYPKEYYAPNAVHVAPYVGVRIPFFFYKPSWTSKVYIHTELGTVDTYLWYSITNRNVKFWDVYNVSLGIYYDF